MSFDSLGLSAALLRAVAEQGYTSPTPIQSQVIPVVLAGRDVMAGAQTGTGKTAGFTLPLLHRLAATPPPAGNRRHVRALILTPTRELAAQVGESVRNYGKHLPLKSAVIFGGVSINPQIAELKRGLDVLVATPGRLLDLANQRALDLRHVEIFVLDEADRMLDMGFLPDIRRVIALLPQQRQNLLFSATFPDDIRALANRMLQSPASIEIGQRNAAAERIEQAVYFVDRGQKRDVLSWLIGSGDWRQVLVFTRTKHGANRLAEQLGQDGLTAAAIHGNKSQGARTRALADFKSGAVRVLVATDIAARGIDIDQLPHVVNFDLPEVPEHYVHRIGRTGRAGAEGLAVSLVAADDRPLLKQIERLLGQSLPQRRLDGYTPRAPRPQESHRPQHGDRQQQGDRRQHSGGRRPPGTGDTERRKGDRPHGHPRGGQQQSGRHRHHESRSARRAAGGRGRG
ncbi:MAG TPA: DEAD/DEAH box helicase [Gammaproteobacteria bacterium]|nr:DEAD/DEAH box helicase [Gammaproteobacteria bacterium]